MADPYVLWEKDGHIIIDVTNGVSSVILCQTCTCPLAEVHWTGEFNPGDFEFCQDDQYQSDDYSIIYHTYWDLSGIIYANNCFHASNRYQLEMNLNGIASGNIDGTLSAFNVSPNFWMVCADEGVWYGYQETERQIAPPAWYTRGNTGTFISRIQKRVGGSWEPYFRTTNYIFAPGRVFNDRSYNYFYACGHNDNDLLVATNGGCHLYQGGWSAENWTIGINSNKRSDYNNGYYQDGYPGQQGYSENPECGDGRIYWYWNEDDEYVSAKICPDFQIDGYQFVFNKNTRIPISYDENNEIIPLPLGTQEVEWTVSGNTFDSYEWQAFLRDAGGGTITSPPSGWSKIEITKL